ncbi:MAG: hypothetical protein M0Q88_08000 [Bacilli bacterium]|nr:hypothetical protein [Bacilli bacterium]
MEKTLIQYGEIISVNDEEFESSLAFNKTIKNFAEAFFESPEYFNNETLVSIYHYIYTDNILTAEQIVGDVEGHIVGKESVYDTDHLLSLLNDGYNWIDFNTKCQVETLAYNIIKVMLGGL